MNYCLWLRQYTPWACSPCHTIHPWRSVLKNCTSFIHLRCRFKVQINISRVCAALVYTKSSIQIGPVRLHIWWVDRRVCRTTILFHDGWVRAGRQLAIGPWLLWERLSIDRVGWEASHLGMKCDAVKKLWFNACWSVYMQLQNKLVCKTYFQIQIYSQK